MQQENQQDIFGDLIFDDTAKQHIRSMASWAMVIVILAVVGYIIKIAQIFSGPGRVVKKSEGFDLGFAMGNNSNPTWDIIAILIGLMINFFLYRFATQSRNAVNGLNPGQLNNGFSNLKSYFIVTTILSIIIFLFVVLFITVLSVGKV